MRTVVCSVISVVAILLVIMTHTVLNEQSVREEELRTALSTAMDQTMSEVFEQGSYGIENRNEMIAAFLQAMLLKVSSDISLTVKIQEIDMREGIFCVEAIADYTLPDQSEKRISVQRQMRSGG